MLKGILSRLAQGRDLSRREAARSMDAIMNGEADDAQIAGFAMALRMKGETPDEIAGCVQALRRRALKVVVGRRLASRIVDTCGTGGDTLGTINVSTLAAVVVAGAGLPVAKHGNRSVSSRCGSADLLEALGVPIDLDPRRAGASLRNRGIAFLFAPKFHPALKQAASARRALGIRTVFNLLGPLCNPAGAKRQLIGVFDGERLEAMACVLRSFGTRRAMLVHGSDGMDELTVTGPTTVVHLDKGRIRRTTVTPEAAGVKRWPLRSLKGGGVRTNARHALAVLEGATGAARDVTLLNAGAALMVGGAARTLKEGVRLAARTIDTGAAGDKLDEIRTVRPRMGRVAS